MALGLPQLKILWPPEWEGYIEVTVIYHRGEARCPRCGKVTHKGQDRRLRDKVFTEPDEVFGSGRRSSYRFREYLGKEALHPTVKRTVRKSGKRRGNGGSRGTREAESRGVSG